MILSQYLDSESDTHLCFIVNICIWILSLIRIVCFVVNISFWILSSIRIVCFVVVNISLWILSPILVWTPHTHFHNHQEICDQVVN
jgi:hypothetical protein